MIYKTQSLLQIIILNLKNINKYLAPARYWRRQNIDGNKILAPTKYTRRQNYLRLQNYWRRQNIGIENIYASTKSWRQWKAGADRKLAQAQENLLTVRLGKSAASDFSQAPLKISYFSLMMVLLSVHAVVKWSIASTCPAFTAGLSPVQYWLVVPAHYAENVQTLAPTKISAAA